MSKDVRKDVAIHSVGGRSCCFCLAVKSHLCKTVRAGGFTSRNVRPAECPCECATVARHPKDSTAETTSMRMVVPLTGGCRTPSVHPYRLKSVTYAVLRAPETSSTNSAGAIKRNLTARRRSCSIVSISDRPGASQGDLLVYLRPKLNQARQPTSLVENVYSE
jgi:hypothetical protein